LLLCSFVPSVFWQLQSTAHSALGEDHCHVIKKSSFTQDLDHVWSMFLSHSIISVEEDMKIDDIDILPEYEDEIGLSTLSSMIMGIQSGATLKSHALTNKIDVNESEPEPEPEPEAEPEPETEPVTPQGNEAKTVFENSENDDFEPQEPAILASSQKYKLNDIKADETPSFAYGSKTRSNTKFSTDAAANRALAMLAETQEIAVETAEKIDDQSIEIQSSSIYISASHRRAPSGAKRLMSKTKKKFGRWSRSRAQDDIEVVTMELESGFGADLDKDQVNPLNAGLSLKNNFGSSQIAAGEGRGGASTGKFAARQEFAPTSISLAIDRWTVTGGNHFSSTQPGTISGQLQLFGENTEITRSVSGKTGRQKMITNAKGPMPPKPVLGNTKSPSSSSSVLRLRSGGKDSKKKKRVPLNMLAGINGLADNNLGEIGSGTVSNPVMTAGTHDIDTGGDYIDEKLAFQQSSGVEMVDFVPMKTPDIGGEPMFLGSLGKQGSMMWGPASSSFSNVLQTKDAINMSTSSTLSFSGERGRTLQQGKSKSRSRKLGLKGKRSTSSRNNSGLESSNSRRSGLTTLGRVEEEESFAVDDGTLLDSDDRGVRHSSEMDTVRGPSSRNQISTAPSSTKSSYRNNLRDVTKATRTRGLVLSDSRKESAAAVSNEPVKLGISNMETIYDQDFENVEENMPVRPVGGVHIMAMDGQSVPVLDSGDNLETKQNEIEEFHDEVPDALDEVLSEDMLELTMLDELDGEFNMDNIINTSLDMSYKRSGLLSLPQATLPCTRKCLVYTFCGVCILPVKCVMCTVQLSFLYNFFFGNGIFLCDVSACFCQMLPFWEIHCVANAL